MKLRTILEIQEDVLRNAATYDVNGWYGRCRIKTPGLHKEIVRTEAWKKQDARSVLLLCVYYHELYINKLMRSTLAVKKDLSDDITRVVVYATTKEWETFPLLSYYVAYHILYRSLLKPGTARRSYYLDDITKKEPQHKPNYEEDLIEVMALCKMSARYRVILNQYFLEHKRLHVIAESQSVSKQRIKQILTKALKKVARKTKVLLG